MAKFYSEKEIKFIIDNYNKLGTKNCAKIFNVSVENFRARLNRLNIKAIGNPFPELSDDQVENIRKEISIKKLNVNFDTNENKKELAYFLGYFWADGYINKNNCLIIEITQEDGEQILPIFQKLADFNIYYRTRINRKPQMTFYTSSKEVCDLFKTLGKYPNSIESHDKILKYIPKEYHQWFLRGFIDGDGCFYLNQNNNCVQFSICGAENQNWTSMLQLCIDFGLTNAKICKRSQTSGNSSIIRSTSKHTIINFINNLYNDLDNIWLNRKFIKAIKIKNGIK